MLNGELLSTLRIRRLSVVVFGWLKAIIPEWVVIMVGFTGADLAALVREAGLAVLKEWRRSEPLQSREPNNIGSGVASGDTAHSIGESLWSGNADPVADPAAIAIAMTDHTTDIVSRETETVVQKVERPSSLETSAAESAVVVSPVVCGTVICARHFEAAFAHVRPSVAAEERKR